MTESLYKSIKKFDGKKLGSGIHWYCGGCNGKVCELLKGIGGIKEKQELLERDIEEIKKELINIRGGMISNSVKKEELMVEVRKEIAEGAQAFAEGNKEMKTEAGRKKEDEREVQIQVNEMLERDKSKLNLVIMGVSEDETEGEGDEEKVQKMLDELLERERVKYSLIGRVGKKGTRETAIRPIRIKIETIENKGKILKKARNLKEIEEYRKVYIVPDMTRKQQEEDKTLRDKVKEFRAKGMEGVRIQRGNVGERLRVRRRWCIKERNEARSIPVTQRKNKR